MARTPSWVRYDPFAMYDATAMAKGFQFHYAKLHVRCGHCGRKAAQDEKFVQRGIGPYGNTRKAPWWCASCYTDICSVAEALPESRSRRGGES